MKVEGVMTSPVVSVTTATPFREIVQLMRKHRISGIPVVDASGSVVGVVTEGDLVLKEHRPDHVRFHAPFGSADEPQERRRRVEGTVAGELMTSPAVTVEAHTDLRVAARLMTLHGVARLPVTKDHKLVGIASRSDVLSVFLRPDAEIRREITEDILSKKVLEDVPDLAIAVEDGVVTLRGVVPRRSTGRLIAFHVDRLDGVTKVVNRLSYHIDDITSPVRPEPAPVGPLEQIL